MRQILLLPVMLLLAGCDVTSMLGDDLHVNLVAPLAGAGTGSVHSATTGRPVLRWRSSAQAQSFHLQVDDSCTAAATCDFPSPEIDEPALNTSTHVPASPLAAADASPFVRRYYWRVQACGADACGEWSEPRYFVVGQDLALNRDINGDGYADFLVGAPENSDSPGHGGRAFIYLGGPSLPSAPAKIISSDITLDWLGHDVAMAGDVNGDGYGDYLVRSTGNNMSIGTQVGRVLLFYGGLQLSDQPDIVFPAGSPDDNNGSMVGCGDLDGDGYDDIAFGAEDVDINHTAILPTRVEIHLGGPAMASSAPLVLYGDTHPIDLGTMISVLGDFFGSSVSGAGDVNGDGYPDLLVGSHQDPSGATAGGKVRIYFGGPQMDATADVVLANPVQSGPAGLFGCSVAGVGDVNGDGFADVAVGARDSGGYPSVPGKAYVFFGGSTPDAIPDVTYDGPNTLAYFGDVVVAAGDVNHDGLADLAVMSRGLSGVDVDPSLGRNLTPGQVVLYTGGQVPEVTPIATMTGQSDFPVNHRLAVVDLDGDGQPEILASQWASYESPVHGRVTISRSSDNYATPVGTLSGWTSNADLFGFALSR